MGLNITNETDIKDEKYYETMSGLVLDFLKGIYKDEKFSVEFKGDK